MSGGIVWPVAKLSHRFGDTGARFAFDVRAFVHDAGNRLVRNADSGCDILHRGSFAALGFFAGHGSTDRELATGDGKSTRPDRSENSEDQKSGCWN
jgi:hypothetical protein